MSNWSNTVVTLGMLTIFTFTSLLPIGLVGENYDNHFDKEAIFGWCKLKRLKKQTTCLIKSLEEFKRGEKSVDEITLQIDSLKKTANQLFKANYEVQQIIQLANQRIENYFHALSSGHEKSLNKACSASFDQINNPNFFDLREQYSLINEFLSELEELEAFSDAQNDIEIEDLDDFTYSNEEQLMINLLKSIQYNTTRETKDTDIESNILFAYVSVFCGCLLCIIPTPMTRNAGFSLISGGLYVLGEDKMSHWDEENKKHSVTIGSY